MSDAQQAAAFHHRAATTWISEPSHDPIGVVTWFSGQHARRFNATRIGHAGASGLVSVGTAKGNAVRLTIDSSEPLDDAMRVLGALYGVRLVIAGDNGADNEAAAAPSTGASRGKPTRKSATRRRAEILAAPTSAAGAGTQAAPARKRVPREGRSRASVANAEIRAWARDHGMTVSGRGRIPGAVMTAYREAQAR